MLHDILIYQVPAGFLTTLSFGSNTLVEAGAPPGLLASGGFFNPFSDLCFHSKEWLWVTPLKDVKGWYCFETVGTYPSFTFASMNKIPGELNVSQ